MIPRSARQRFFETLLGLDELAGKGVKSPLELPIELVPRKSSAKLI